MRNAVFAAYLILSGACVAAAQTEPVRPQNPAPAAASPIDQRDSWCQKYASWYVAQTPGEMPPADVRPTQRLETEINSCKLDPQEYERETLVEVAEAIERT